jgi:WD40 repeat protein
LLSPLAEHDFGAWESLLALAWPPDGGTLALAAGNRVYLLRIPALEQLFSLEVGATSPGLAASPDGKLLAAGSRDGQVRLIDIDPNSQTFGQVITQFEAHHKGVNGVAFSPGGKQLASGGNDAVARVWEIPSGRQLAQYIGGTFAVPDVEFSPQGSSLAIVNGSLVRERDTQSARFLRTYQAEHALFDVAFSPDGSRLAGGSLPGSLEIWDATSGERLIHLPLLEGASSLLVWQVAYSPDGTLLAAASGDGSLYLIEAQTARLIARLKGGSSAMTSAAFSPDGRLIATGSLDGKLKLWGARGSEKEK